MLKDSGEPTEIFLLYFFLAIKKRTGDTGQTTTMALTNYSFSDCIYGLLYETEILSDTVFSGVIGSRGESTGYGIKLTSNELL